MTKEEKMQAVEKAIDMGAKIDITFHDCSSQEEAEQTIKVFSSILNKEYHQEAHNGHDWVQIGNPPYVEGEEESEEKTPDDNFEVVVFYDHTSK
ncbi:hypothetical protein BKM15_25910 [Pseudomonas syringae pv. syringae]|nr:hypothetical protein BKM15_25910 [Pseudomonas syringae pv. syringae]